MRRIGIKLWAGMMLLVAAVLIILWLFQIVFLDQFYKNIKISDLIEKSNGIIAELEKSESLTEGIASGELQDSIDNLAYTMQLSVEIIDDQRNAVYEADYSNNTMSRGMMKNANSEVYEIALSGEVAKLEAKHPRFGSSYALIGLPIRAGDMTIGAMVLNIPLAPVEDTAAILKQQLLWITLILLVVSVIIAYYLSKTFTKPILNIHKVAESYSMGQFDLRVKTGSKDELGQLADRINRMGEELAKNDQLRKDLIANVSHELRTPLSLIRGYAETLRDVTGENPEKREKQLGVIIDETERLTRIVEDILSLSQYQAGAIVLDIQAFSLKQMLDDIMERYHVSQSLREMNIIGISDNDVQVLGDKGRIEQVLYNLLNNAVSHTKEDGRILIKLTGNPDTIKIEVIDDGEGIDAEELPNVYERYYKGKKAERSKKGGTGLGLAIVKNILQMHQVPFGVQSKIGVGTTFWFELTKDNSHTSF